MLFQRFFKQPKPNKFGYTPVYYDERKIDRERKIKEAQQKSSENGEYVRENMDFRGKFHKEGKLARNQSLDKFRSQGSTRSNRTLIIVVLAIAAIVYIQLRF